MKTRMTKLLIVHITCLQLVQLRTDLLTMKYRFQGFEIDTYLIYALMVIDNYFLIFDKL